jgi:Kef-type K+ transport system membrane component KefB
MTQLHAYQILILLCSIVVLSYLISIISRLTRVPSVLMLLGFGVLMQQISLSYGNTITIPRTAIEILGTVGLIMIILEAALDLKVSQEKLPLIKASFISAAVILLVSSVVLAGIFHFFLHTSIHQSILYALPFGTVSSAIVLPSVGHLSESKREFLIYEASFSDIIGILLFNLFATGASITLFSLFGLIFGTVGAILFSLLISAILLFLLLNHRTNVKFFLTFAVLILVYVIGKLTNLPSLITILIFGIVVNNWNLFQLDIIQKYLPQVEVSKMADLLKSITNETSFLVRTFFFIAFGISIDMTCFTDIDALKMAGMVMLGLVLTRFIYLRVLNRDNLFPEVLYSPRGLISVLLFYKIPDHMLAPNFKVGILVIVIVASNLIMMLGSILYKQEIQFVQKEMESA